MIWIAVSLIDFFLGWPAYLSFVAHSLLLVVWVLFRFIRPAKEVGLCCWFILQAAWPARHISRWFSLLSLFFCLILHFFPFTFWPLPSIYLSNFYLRWSPILVFLSFTHASSGYTDFASVVVITPTIECELNAVILERMSAILFFDHWWWVGVTKVREVWKKNGNFRIEELGFIEGVIVVRIIGAAENEFFRLFILCLSVAISRVRLMIFSDVSCLLPGYCLLSSIFIFICWARAWFFKSDCYLPLYFPTFPNWLLSLYSPALWFFPQVIHSLTEQSWSIPSSFWFLYFC